MNHPTHVTVTAPDGRLTPIHPDDGVGLGGAPLRVDSARVARVRWSQTTRRAVERGDLILCTRAGKAVPTAREAACPEDLPGGSVSLERAAARDLPASNMRAPEGGVR